MSKGRGWVHGATEYYWLYRGRLLPVQGVVVIVALFLQGLDMIVQSDRWHRTPAYHNLLIILNADAWGAIHVAASVSLAVALFVLGRYRMASVVAHTVVIALLATWEVAFIVRWITDTGPHAGTTAANPINWGVLVFLAVRSAMLYEQPTLAAVLPSPLDNGGEVRGA